MKELKKVGKYQDPKIEVQLYNFRVNFISVVISTLGTISEKLEKKVLESYLKWNPQLYSIATKTSFSEKSFILARVLDISWLLIFLEKLSL